MFIIVIEKKKEKIKQKIVCFFLIYQTVLLSNMSLNFGHLYPLYVYHQQFYSTEQQITTKKNSLVFVKFI